MHKIIIYLISITILLFSGRIFFITDDINQLFIAFMGVIMPLVLIKWLFKANPISEIFKNNKTLGIIFYLLTLSFLAIQTGILMSHYELITETFGFFNAVVGFGLFATTLLLLTSIDKVNKRWR
ncbi:hypothetical protein Bcop_2002 [Bacteroides coprosuis DSM 18011]|uniref:Transmembrane protein n=1 Tax=Bacteroides coprosuis DSM 18011 TaxID=679937 RepID=F3ZST6_9BACE|nr:MULTISPECIES: hypothetical protein [Bacteroides]EGJ72177.1 hypothetical protein Bcop_2002 [Bacteroides coprosuis DSM 18011]